MELIDRKAIGSPIYISGWGEAYDAKTIEYADVADAVSVVRCGKCKHYRDGRCYRDGYAYDKWASGDTSESPQNAPVYYGLKATDFCSHGEPRTPPAE